MEVLSTWASMDPDLTSRFYSSVCARGIPSLQKNSASPTCCWVAATKSSFHRSTIHYTLWNTG